MLLFEWIGSVIVLDQSWPDALYGSTKSLATVGPNPAVDDGPEVVQGDDRHFDAADAVVGRVLHERA